MKKLVIMLLCAGTLLMACVETNTGSNPFFSEWNTSFGVPPFEQIRTEDYIPAYERGMELEKAEIDSIVNNPAAPSFENTILAYSNSGEFLSRVSSVFGCIAGTDLTPELEEIQKTMTPVLTGHRSDISLNPALFDRIRAVYDGRDSLCADALQLRLTEKVYKGFERSGANLPDDKKGQLRKIDTELSKLTQQFGRNLRADNNAFTLIIENKADLAGLTESIIANAADEAKSRGEEGKWVFTLDRPSLFPFLQYAENRALREQIYKGYIERCNHNDANDNKSVLDSIAQLRLERSNLLEYSNHAVYVLEQQMAKYPEAVYALLDELWTPALKRSKEELKEIAAIKVKEGQGTDFEAWDWWFYAEKLRKAKYDLDEDELRPYFPLNGVRDGIFTLTNKLYGVTYRELKNAPKYNPQNQVFEVSDKDGSHLGVLYLDFHPRKGKRVGAWCTSFRGQSCDAQGNRIAPVVSIVCNFTKPAGDTPALLNLDEVETFFHEFGHGMHNLFSMAPYKGLRRTERDFVELPSQVMENWAFEPEMLALYAKHYKTNEVIPQALADKIQASGLFNQGFATVEYLAASYLDMDYHTLNRVEKLDVPAFEKSSMRKLGLIPQIAPRYRSTYFQHIFSGGYASGYYSYIWSEVLDKDAFAAFVESGDLFNKDIAARFRVLLSKGGMEDGGALYREFRGKEASKEPLLKARGLK